MNPYDTHRPAARFRWLLGLVAALAGGCSSAPKPGAGSSPATPHVSVPIIEPSRPAAEAPASAATGDPSRPSPQYSDEITRLYECWLKEPYPFMFRPEAKSGTPLGVFTAGTQGILAYGSLARCMAEVTSVVYRFNDPAPFNAFLKMTVVERDRSAGAAFSHIRVEAVRWGHETLIPPPATLIGDRTAQEHYDETFRRFFRLMAAGYLYLAPDGVMKVERADYEREVIHAKKEGLSWLHARYQHAYESSRTAWVISAPDPTQPTMGHWTLPVSIGFWLRRDIDGTRSELWRGLLKLLLEYDADFNRRYVTP
ncbi:MAG: hypothetical protein AAGA56_18095 [Myxococcota bacterium]